MGASILDLAKSIYYTFQAFEENSFTIISKKSESSSIMKARRLQELGCSFESSRARFDRPMMGDT